jgi:hypothetical protein
MNSVFTPLEQDMIQITKRGLEQFVAAHNVFWNGITDDCVIAGGYFASALNNKAFKDIDVFILNGRRDIYDSFVPSNAEQQGWQVRGDAAAYLENSHIKATALNPVNKVQYILTDYKDRKELLNNFDYRHCTVSYVPSTKLMYVTRGAFDDIISNTLTPNGDNVPKGWRKHKFLNRGWRLAMLNPPSTNPLFERYNELLKEKLILSAKAQ